MLVKHATVSHDWGPGPSEGDSSAAVSSGSDSGKKLAGSLAVGGDLATIHCLRAAAGEPQPKLEPEPMVTGAISFRFPFDFHCVSSTALRLLCG